MTSRARRGWLAAVVTAIALFAGCGSGHQEAGDDNGGTAARTYQVRGVLQALPNPETGAGELRIRHEAIPDFVGAGGEVDGMAAMTMPFPVAAEVDLDGFAAGDLVLFDLRIDWQADRPVAVTALEKLAADTELTLE